MDKKCLFILAFLAFTFMTLSAFFYHKSIAEASAGSVFRCSNCGSEIYCGGRSTPKDYNTNTYGCGGDINKRHNWYYVKSY